MTGFSEFGSSLALSDFPTNLVQEGLARNFYNACGGADIYCTNQEIYWFATGYQLWFDSSKTPSERANLLLSYLNSDINREKMQRLVAEVLDFQNARVNKWTEGLWNDKPFKWYNLTVQATDLGYGRSQQAITSYPMPDGTFFTIFTAYQGNCFKNQGFASNCYNWSGINGD